MKVRFTNVKETLSLQGIDVSNDFALSDKIFSIFPNTESWSYDIEIDILTIYTSLPSGSNELGEVIYE